MVSMSILPRDRLHLATALAEVARVAVAAGALPSAGLGATEDTGVLPSEHQLPAGSTAGSLVELTETALLGVARESALRTFPSFLGTAQHT